MVGFYARADSTKPIRTDLDNELVGEHCSVGHHSHHRRHSRIHMPDARWFTRQEVESVLGHSTGTTFRQSDYKKMAEIVDGASKPPSAPLDPAAQALTPRDDKAKQQYVPPPSDGDPPFRLPPITAIAGVLIRDWIERKVGFPIEENFVQKGNL